MRISANVARVGKAAVGDGVQVREVEHGADPAAALRDLEHVRRRAELTDPSHDLDAEGNRAILLLQARAQFAQLLDDGVDRGVALAAEQEPGVEHDRLGPRAPRDAGRVVEHPDGHVQLLAALGVAHEARDRRMDGEDDSSGSRQLAEALRPGVVHPELALEVDLAGRVALLLEEGDRRLRALAGRNPGRPEVQGGHEAEPSAGPAVRPPFYPHSMLKKPSRIDLLELDIDLRLTDLWREAGEIAEWNLDVVAAFMRAAYGKGYCDALTEDAPGSLCHDHGYRIPGRRPAPAHD